RLALHATLPDRYAQHEVLASTIDHRGRLTALVTDPARRLSEPRYEATAVICAGPELHEIPLTDLRHEVTLIDTHGDGIVLAAARCEPTGIELPPVFRTLALRSPLIIRKDVPHARTSPARVPTPRGRARAPRRQTTRPARQGRVLGAV